LFGLNFISRNFKESLAKGTTGEIYEEDKTKTHAAPGAARLGATQGSAYTVPQKRDGARAGEAMIDRKRGIGLEKNYSPCLTSPLIFILTFTKRTFRFQMRLLLFECQTCPRMC